MCVLSCLEASSCIANLDMVFLVDGSRSIERDSPGKFREALTFVKSTIGAFRVDQPRIRASVIVFSTKPKEIFSLGKYHAKTAMFKAIDAIQNPAAGSDIGKALKFTKTLSFDYSKPNVSRVVVVLTDGLSKDDVQKPSKMLAGMGVSVLVVTIGKSLSTSQLKQMISGQPHDHLFDPKAADAVEKRIARGVCKSLGKLVLSIYICLLLCF